MNAKKQPDNLITALYERLSRDDILQGESNSIKNQKQILEDFAVKNGFGNIRHYDDDGYTGLNFDRPNWQKLIADIESGLVGTVIVKDNSRVGRDYLQVGFYTEVFFRQKGVRFISIHHSVDSKNGEGNEFAPFINIMSEWYSKDISRKIKTAMHAKGNSGKPTSNNVLYGFMKDPNDKDNWLIDEEAAAVVRRIFQMALNGLGTSQIARLLYEDKIERPSVYFAKNRIVGPKQPKTDLSNPYAWNGGTVRNILSKPEYVGHTVNFRTNKESYKDKQSKWNPKEDWKIFENTHPAIIDQTTFDTVQKLRSTPRRPVKCGEANPLTGLVFCADCGNKMYNSRYSNEYFTENRMGKTYQHKHADSYSCSGYELAKGMRMKCTKHFIRTVVIRELVLDMIRRISGYIRDNEDEFVEKIRAESAVKQDETAKAHKSDLTKNERRIAELDGLFRKVYEDNAAGKLSDERYTQLSSAYEKEQTELRERNVILQAELTAFDDDSLKTDRFIEMVKRYTDFEELTTPMLNEFIDKILVHEADKSSGERVQQVDIYFNFIGNFTFPEEITPPTPEELAAKEKLRRKRELQRAANARWYAKKTAEYKAKKEAEKQLQAV